MEDGRLLIPLVQNNIENEKRLSNFNKSHFNGCTKSTIFVAVLSILSSLPSIVLLEHMDIVSSENDGTIPNGVRSEINIKVESTHADLEKARDTI